MKTVLVNGVRLSVKYKTCIEMRTKASYRNRLYKQGLGCDVYSVEDGQLALVLNSINGDILNSVVVISKQEYEKIAELYEPTATGQYHTALLTACGAINHLKLI